MSSLATTLNGKVPSWRSIFKILGGGLLASVLFVLAAIGLPNWLKWVPETLYFIAMSVTIFGVLCISVRATLVAAERLKALSEEAIAAVDIRNKVGAIIPLEALPQGFESKAIAAATDELPAVRGEWRSILADEKILKEYAEYIDQRRNAVTYEVFSAINRFNRDRTLLIEQRKNVLRRAFRAQRFVRRFKDLPKISVTFSTLPEFERLSIPPQPPFLNAQQYSQKYATIPKTAGYAMTRLAQVNGAGINAGNAAAVLIGAAALAIHAKAMISKSLRAMEDARGKVNEFASEGRKTVELLEKAHTELVTASFRMKDVAEEIDALAQEILDLPQQVSTLDALAPDKQQRVKTLWYWIASAKCVSHTQV